MQVTIFYIIFYLLLIDSIVANLIAWFGGEKWYKSQFQYISRYFPVARGWTTYYFILILIMGVMLVALTK